MITPEEEKMKKSIVEFIAHIILSVVLFIGYVYLLHYVSGWILVILLFGGLFVFSFYSSLSGWAD
jgi:hypothetical protein